MTLTVAHVSIPKPGETANGDRAFYRRDPDGGVVLGLIDGLGHGPAAELVSTTAVDALAAMSLHEPMMDIMLRLHECLKGTRGAAGTVCVIREYDMYACAVGNVEFRCSETPVPLISSPGILGVRVQKFRVCHAKLKPAARLVLFSDGISTSPRLAEVRALPPRDACETVLRLHRNHHDDATILVADVE